MSVSPLRQGATRVRDESSNSFALFVVMLPMLMGAFGLGLDISRNVYIRTDLQNSLDLAVVGGAASTVDKNNGGIKIDAEKAIASTEKIYAANRPAKNLTCFGGGSIPDSDATRCWEVVEHSFTNSNTEFSYTVHEQSRNAFLPVIGIEYQQYTVSAHAAVRQDADSNNDPNPSGG